MSAGVVGHCHECQRAMGSRQNHKRFGLVQHFGRGYCKHCYVRVVIRAPLAVETRRALLPLTPAWMKQAPCATSGQPDAWFPDKGVSTKPARKICGSCRYVAPCLTWAVQNRERGIWGGLTEVERQGLDLFGDEERQDGEAAA